jgi:hypothetical protein
VIKIFWKKKEKEINLLIGVISKTTLENNFDMIEREYNRKIDKYKEQLNELNAKIIYSVKEGITKYIFNNYNHKYCICSSVKWTSRQYLLTNRGEKELNRLFKQIKLPVNIIKDDSILNRIDDLQDELKDLQNKYKNEDSNNW